MARPSRSSDFDAFDDDRYDPVSDPPTLYELTDAQAIAAIKDWFFENFEDFSRAAPSEGAGGTQHIFGGPYEARDIIENAFYRRIRSNVREAAIEEIERDSELWIPSEARRRALDEETDEPERQDAGTRAERHARMLEGIRLLEQVIRDLPLAPAGMGHNRPPEPLEVEPLDAADKAELAGALTTLNAQPVTPPDGGTAASAALEVVESKRAKLAKWLAKQGDLFATEAFKEAGKSFGKWLPPAAFLALADRLYDVSALVKTWLSTMHLPF